MKIITNHQPRDLVTGADVPPAILASEFDYLDADARECHDFFCYRGTWYCLDAFVTGAPAPGWDGFAADTFFSGTLVRFVDDGERVIVGRCYS